MAQRTLTSVVFVAIMLGGLLFNPILCGALMLVIEFVAMSEFYQITIGQSLKLQQKLSLVAVFLFFVLELEVCRGVADSRLLSLALLIPVLLPVTAVFSSDHADFRQIAYIYAGMLYIGLPIGLAPRLMFSGNEYDGLRFLSLFIIIWGSDVGAFLVGSWLGQKEGARRLAPKISPKKSWWGFAGAVLFGVICALATKLLSFLDVPVVHVFAIGVLVSVSAVAGDLVESLWKRSFNVKDSGTCIPGHGGMLDRFDSSIVAIPVAAVYLSIFNIL